MLDLVRRFWSEPPPPPPARGGGPAGVPWSDVGLVVVLAPLALLEGHLRAAPAIAVACAVVVVVLLAWRSRHPFGACCAAFGLTLACNVAVIASGAAWQALSVTAAILLLPYSLFRWGAGRDAIVGLGVIGLVYLSSAVGGEMKDVSEGIGAAVVLLAPATVGGLLRLRDQSQRRELETARVLERERLARDLHDTVAHHVAAIVIQAQAGRLVAATRPEAAARALGAIEAEAARALTELRALVGILRDGDAPLAPQPGLADVALLAGVVADGRVVDVAIADDVIDLRPSVAAAIFRIAQEAVTNAVRHARGATRIAVLVELAPDVMGDVAHASAHDIAHASIRIVVDDDGAKTSARSAGFGLAGMAERAALLGGRCRAGPRAGGGWRVEAVLPRAGGPTSSRRA